MTGTVINFLPARYSSTFGGAVFASSDQRASGSAIRVLIVEDEALVALDMEATLSAGGFVVEGIVDTEREAIREALRLNPDVIIMDITLREGSGLAAARAINRPASIVFVSGNSDQRAMAETDAATFLNKPFSRDNLMRAVRAASRQRNDL